MSDGEFHCAQCIKAKVTCQFCNDNLCRVSNKNDIRFCRTDMFEKENYIICESCAMHYEEQKSKYVNDPF